MNEELDIYRIWDTYLNDDGSKIYYADHYSWETNPKPNKKGMYKINVDLRSLMEDWMDDLDFKEGRLSMADLLLIKTYLKDGEYDEEGKEFLNKIRERWIKYKNK